MFWLLFNGFLAVVMGLIYFWLTQLTFAGSQTAQVLISVFAVINIVFGFFHFDSGGAAQIVINLIVVLIVQRIRRNCGLAKRLSLTGGHFISKGHSDHPEGTECPFMCASAIGRVHARLST